jgi:hypothetical protein
MRRPSPLPDGFATRPFSTSEALRAGISRQRMRSSELHSPYFGVRTQCPPTTTLERAGAYSRRMGPGQFFSHLTAAELLDMRLPDDFQSCDLHVSSTPPVRASRSEGVIGHQANLVYPSGTIRGLPVSSPIDTWLMLGSVLTIDELTVLGDGLLGRVAPAADLSQLANAVACTAGRRGQRRLESALRQMRPGTASARETLLRLLIVRAGLPEPEVNGLIVNPYGAVVGHGDLVFRRYRTIVDYDGGGHRPDERHVESDRLNERMEQDWHVIRVGPSLMSQTSALLAKVSTALEDGGWYSSAG